jgi:WD40 repeat protein/pimeloyl-ACP methyl ester carboxylesterase
MSPKEIISKLKDKFMKKLEDEVTPKNGVVRASKNGVNIIFLHGIKSDRRCWKHKNGNYWPTMLEKDERFANTGIYNLAYHTGYDVKSLNVDQIVQNLTLYFGKHKLFDASGIIFIAHSMGGIVARKFLIKNKELLFGEGSPCKIRLFLIASPSGGSPYANLLSPVLGLLGHTQGCDLKLEANNSWLADLNDNSKEIFSDKGKELISGKELVEQRSPFPWWLDRLFRIPPIVEQASAAYFFPGWEVIPNSNHFTIATPENEDAQQHQILVGFIEKFLNEPLNNQQKTRSLFWNVPNYQSYCLPRPDEIEELKSNLFNNSVVRVTGMGGIGKSVLAAKIAHDLEVRQTFPGGIFWLTVGQEGRLATFQERLATALSDNPTFTDVDQGLIKLKSLFSDRTCLLILDDIWEPEQLKSLNCVGAQGKILITTRNKGITGLTGVEHPVKLLTDPQAQRLLAKLTKKKEHDLPPEANEIVKECGGLPLALAMIGGALLGHPINRWKDILDSLQSADLKGIEHHLDRYDYFNLQKAMQVSVDVLERELYDRYLDFAVFPEDVAIPERVLEIWWSTKKLNSKKVRKVIDKLADRSLLQQQDEKIKLHDLQMDFLRKKKEGEIKNLHQDWISAYRLQYPQGWHDLTDDGYCFDGVPYHLQKAEEFHELRELLLDFRWLQAKLRATTINQVLQDYDRLPEEKVLTLVRNSLRLSAHVLADDKQQLAERLWGHLLGQELPEIQKLLEQATLYQSGVWLRPLTANLTSPDGSLLQTLVNKSSANAVVVFNGKYIISALNNATLELSNLTTGEVLKTFIGHTHRVNAVAVLPDEKRAISASDDKTLKIWDLQTGKVIRTLSGHTYEVHAVAVLPDKNGTRAISASDDETLKLWDLQTGEVIQTFSGHRNPVYYVAIYSNGTRAISASGDNTLKVWNLDTGENLHTLSGHSQSVHSVAVFSNGTRAISASSDGTMKVWNLDTNEVVQTLLGHSFRVISVVVLPNEKYAISTSADLTLKLWDIDTGKVVQTLIGHSDWVTSVAVRPDARQAISASYDRTLKIWNLDVSEVIQTSTEQVYYVTSVAVLSNGKRAISTSNDGTLKVWNLDTGKVLQTLAGHSEAVLSVAVLPDEKRAISASDDKTLKLWDLNTGEVIRTLTGHTDSVKSVKVLSNGKHAISASQDKTLKLWDLDTGEATQTISGHKYTVNSVAVFSDDNRVISASNDKTLKVWDLNRIEATQNIQEIMGFDSTMGILQTLEEHSDSVWSVEVFSNGTRAISASNDGTLKVWDLDTGKVIRTLAEHSSSVNSVAVFSNGMRAISASNDSTLKVWNLDTGEVIFSLIVDNPFYCCVVAPDEVTIVAGDLIGRVHFFRLEQQDFGLQNNGQHGHRKDSIH